MTSSAPPSGRNGLTYRDAGVDIDAGDALVEEIKPLARSTVRAGTDAALGGFGAFFDLKGAGFRDPILVASTDGVGTKLLIAIELGDYTTIGIDLVAMSVNDVVVQGASPLFFLDYYATSKLDVAAAKQVIAGIAEGCRDAECALIGGETAEMPGLYRRGDFDLAGFAVGAVERDQIVDGRSVAQGDVIIGMASSGVHSNGYSLVRKVVEHARVDYRQPAPFEPSVLLGRALLRPTRIYVRSCLALHRERLVKALAHVTGGGIIDNLPRVLPEGHSAQLDARRWPLPPVFGWLQRAGGIPLGDLLRTFNCGIGMAAVVAATNADRVLSVLRSTGESAWEIGRIVRRPGESVVDIDHAEDAWRD